MYIYQHYLVTLFPRQTQQFETETITPVCYNWKWGNDHFQVMWEIEGMEDSDSQSCPVEWASWDSNHWSLYSKAQLLLHVIRSSLLECSVDFPEVQWFRDPPANAEDIVQPWSGKFHMPETLLSLCSKTCQPHLQGHHAPQPRETTTRKALTTTKYPHPALSTSQQEKYKINKVQCNQKLIN